MHRELLKESENLKYMWNRHPSRILAQYLQTDFFDPFYNPQHIFTRKLITDYLNTVNNKINFSMEDRLLEPLTNLYFKNMRKGDPTPWKYAWKQSSYIMAKIKSLRLSRHHFKKISILDIGCGAGNYYAGIKESGLSSFLDYTGIDIAEKNIAICKNLYRDGAFEVGNIYDLKFADNAFDIVLIGHVFEHLDPRFLKHALHETLRVTREKVIINFFLEKKIKDHISNKIDRYHWNCLSRAKLLNYLKPHETQIVDRYPFFSDTKVTRDDGKKILSEYSTWIIKKIK